MRRRPDPSDEQSFDDTPAAVGVDGLAVDPKTLRRLAELEGRDAMSEPKPVYNEELYASVGRYPLCSEHYSPERSLDLPCPGCLAERLEAARKTNAALVNALRAVEWLEAEDGWGVTRNYCPSCDSRHEDGHAPDCQLDKALRAAEPD